MTEIELLEYKIKQLVEDNKAAWSTIRATENARVKAEKERDELRNVLFSIRDGASGLWGSDLTRCNKVLEGSTT